MKRLIVSIVVVCLTGLLGIIVWGSPARGKTFVDILGLFLSWPAVVLIIVLIIGTKFNVELSGLIERIRKLPGGTELAPPQQETEEEAKRELEEQRKEHARLEEHTAVIEKGHKALHNKIASMHEEYASSKLEENRIKEMLTEMDEVAKKLQEERTKDIEKFTTINQDWIDIAKFWKLEFLSLFLVSLTQSVLAWISKEHRQIDEHKKVWHYAQLQEKDIILTVLSDYNLIEQDNNVLKVTEFGREFLEHLTGKGITISPPPYRSKIIGRATEFPPYPPVQ